MEGAGGPSVVVDPVVFASALSKEGKPVIDLPADKSSLKAFLRYCDQALLTAWGDARLERWLAPLGVSLKEWLKAGRELSFREWLDTKIGRS